jgi:DNA modification methylase
LRAVERLPAQAMAMTVRILQGDARARLCEIADNSVDCIITSPPYFGLRSYLPASSELKARELGLEHTIDQWLTNQLLVFTQCYRVLKKRGVMWVNIGDSYYSPRYCGGIGRNSKINGKGSHEAFRQVVELGGNRRPQKGLKPKDRMGIPHRLVFALQELGWWWRDEVVWAKTNPMPESARDRTTKAHEFFFMLTKSERYHFDRRAYAEAAENDAAHGNDEKRVVSGWGHGDESREATERARLTTGERSTKFGREPGWRKTNAIAPKTRNRRSVWSLSTQPYPGSHFATFPTWLVEPALLASCPVDGTVLDPYGGVGTVALVAEQHQRHSILVELNPASCAEAAERLRAASPLFTQVEIDHAQVRNLLVSG